jgi:NADH-quinone oxidoreductase subunit M
MTWPPALPVLTLLVWTPAVGALISAFPGEDRASLRRSLSLSFAAFALALASFLALAFERGKSVRELARWVPSLGLSYDLVLDPFGSVLAVWIALLALMVLGADGFRGLGRRATFLTLLAETALLGVTIAGDAVLLLGFYGVGLLSLTLLLERVEEMKKFFFFQSVGAALAAVYVGVSYHLSWVQTGFPSAEVGRFPSLVSFPDFQIRMLLLGAAVMAFAAPLFPLTSWVSSSVSALTTPGRILLLGGWSLAGSLFFVRAVLPSSPGSAGATGLTVLAALSVLYAGLAPRRTFRTGAPLLVGFQGLVVLGLLSPTAEGVAAGRAGMLHLGLALSAIALWNANAEEARGPTLVGGFTAFLMLCPFWVVIREEWSVSPLLAALAGLGTISMAIRLTRTLPPLSRRRRLLLLPLVVGIWALLLAAPARFVPASSTAPAAEEEEGEE